MDAKHRIELTPDQTEALQADGFVQGESFVLMSIEVYRDLMGIGSDDDLAASLKAIHQGLDDAAMGRTRPFRDVLSDLT